MIKVEPFFFAPFVLDCFLCYQKGMVAPTACRTINGLSSMDSFYEQQRYRKLCCIFGSKDGRDGSCCCFGKHGKAVVILQWMNANLNALRLSPLLAFASQGMSICMCVQIQGKHQ